VNDDLSGETSADVPKNPATAEDILAFGILPNAVARDRRVSCELLVLIGYRCTFAGDYGLNGRAICTGRKHAIASKGLGRDVFRRAIESGQRLGFIKRWQPAKKGSKFAFARDELCLPPAGQSYRHVRRQWFTGQYSLRALAVLLFVRAGTERGQRTFSREISERFEWSAPTTQAAVAELVSAGLMERIERRAGAGRFAGVCYRHTRQPPPSVTRGVACNRNVPSSKLPATGFTGDGESGSILNSSAHTLHKETNHVLHKCCTSRRADAPVLDTATLQVLRETAMAMPSILGWANSEENSLAVYDIDHELVASVYSALDVGSVRETLRKATRRRVNPEILSDAGIYGIIAIAAHLSSQPHLDLTVTDALTVVLKAIERRIGQRGEFLNSLAIIGIRAFGATYDGFDADSLFAGK
jgi:hypothetical protein